MEIEKKFLVKEMPNDLNSFEKIDIIQGYISFLPTIRLRKSNSDFYLTCKSKGNLSRDEWEISISKYEFYDLWRKVEGTPIMKTRYLIPLDNLLVAELDEYFGNLKGFFTVEVEFETEKEALEFVAPSWFGKDITFDSKYKNSNLSKSKGGYSEIKKI